MTIGWEGWFTLGTLVVAVVALVREMARPDIVLLGSLGLLLLAGVVPPEQAFAGFSNSAVLAVGALFVVAAGVQRTGALNALDPILFGKSARVGLTVGRLMLPTAMLSAFLNNTPIVAMFIPRVQQWAERAGVPASRLLIPLSYAAIVGGMATLIGTSTNIVVSGLMEAEGYAPFGMFDLTWVGLPVMLAVILYFATVGYRLLPDRGVRGSAFEDWLRACQFEVKVADRSPVIGQTVEEAGLRALEEAYLVHIVRRDHIIPASPDEMLQAGDVLTFSGHAAMLDRLLERPGLERVMQPVREDRHLPLFEAVVADSSTLVGKTLREAAFRDHYGGVVLAIQRKDKQQGTSLGRVPIQAGDLLLVEAQNGFDKRWNARRNEFYLVAPRRDARDEPKTGKAPLALVIMIGMVVLVATDVLPLVTATFAAALGMIATKCIRLSEARRAVDISVLLVIAAALGIGKAAENTGLAAVAADGMIWLTTSVGMVPALAVLYVATNVLTELITHKAAAVLMVPVAIAAALELGIEPKAFALVVAVAAAASFMTPIGYQTNLMVMSAGGYRYRDYLKVGAPVSFIVMLVAVGMIYSVWIQ